MMPASDSMKALIVIILVAVAAYLGYRIMSKPKPTETPVVEMQPAPESAVPAQPEPAPPSNLTTNRPTVVLMTNKAATPKPQPTLEWKPKMDEILAANANAETKLRQLRELLSRLPEVEAEAAVQELTFRVKDETFAFIKPLVVDPALPETVRDEFMVDLMNRPNSIKMPLFLEIARNPDHPDNEHVSQTLEAFTGLKLGADWNGWEKGIEQWLKENPDRVRKAQAPAEEAN